MKIKDYIGLLKSIHLFKYFNNEELISLFEESNYKIKSYKKNTLIYIENEECKTVDIVLDGEIAIQKIGENGNIFTITKFNKGDILGENLIFSSNNYYPVNIICKKNTIILSIKKEFILDLCKINKTFLLEFLKSISDKTLILASTIKNISMKSIRESIIDFLNQQYYIQNSLDIKLNITKKELAEKLGFQRTSLSRELNKMKKDGLVSYNKNSIKILDMSIINKNI